MDGKSESYKKCKILRKRKASSRATFCIKKERNIAYKKISSILQKPLADRDADELEILSKYQDIARQISYRITQRQRIKDRALEYEDASETLAEKCKILAEALSNSNHLVVYTGAGISTAARIPDYRGSNGIWTLLQQGKDIGMHDLSRAEPTTTHMALYSLYRTGLLKHIVSQNCDGLHLRSGLPRTILSEVHGNMYIEVCVKCKPQLHYLRLFDVTEHTARFSHKTLRLCYKCRNPLKDTIVHFGERGKLQWPLNWETACKQADMADVILCLGSSLKVLKKYPWLWCMDKRLDKRPKLYIVNLQWTPKDNKATLKINGKCDSVLEQVMSHLGLAIPKYVRSLDPIFHHATDLNDLETHTTSQPCLEFSSSHLLKIESRLGDKTVNKINNRSTTTTVPTTASSGNSVKKCEGVALREDKCTVTNRSRSNSISSCCSDSTSRSSSCCSTSSNCSNAASDCCCNDDGDTAEKSTAAMCSSMDLIKYKNATDNVSATNVRRDNRQADRSRLMKKQEQTKTVRCGTRNNNGTAVKKRKSKTTSNSSLSGCSSVEDDEENVLNNSAVKKKCIDDKNDSTLKKLLDIKDNVKYVTRGKVRQYLQKENSGTETATARNRRTVTSLNGLSSRTRSRAGKLSSDKNVASEKSASKNSRTDASPVADDKMLCALVAHSKTVVIDKPDMLDDELEVTIASTLNGAIKAAPSNNDNGTKVSWPVTAYRYLTPSLISPSFDFRDSLFPHSNQVLSNFYSQMSNPILFSQYYSLFLYGLNFYKTGNPFVMDGGNNDALPLSRPIIFPATNFVKDLKPLILGSVPLETVKRNGILVENAVIIKEEKLTLDEKVEDTLSVVKQFSRKSNIEECTFCCSYYNSYNCMFYVKCRNNVNAGPACICCADSAEDDEEEEENGDSVITLSDEMVEKQFSVRTTQFVNPGWFGKGYRKRVVKKRK